MFPVIRLTWTNSNWHAWHLAVDDNLDQVDLAASEYYSEGHLYRKDGLPIKMDSFYSEIWHPIHSYLLQPLGFCNYTPIIFHINKFLLKESESCHFEIAKFFKYAQSFQSYTALTKQEGPEVCWDSPKMSLLLNCHLLCFIREEQFSVLPSKNKVADEKTTG